MHLGLLRHQPGQDSPQAQRLLTQRRSHPVVAGGRGVPLVEHQVDDFEHRRQTVGQLGRLGDLEGDTRLGERALGPYDPLRDGRLPDQERPRDLLGLQPPEQPQREGDPRLGGEHRVARGEHQAQQVVLDVAVQGGVQVGLGALSLGPQLVAQLFDLAFQPLFAADEVDGAALADGHEPGARIVWDAGLGPLLQRGDQSVLRELLGEADVSHDACETGDHPGRLDPPDRVDRAMCIGGRHGHLSEHLLR